MSVQDLMFASDTYSSVRQALRVQYVLNVKSGHQRKYVKYKQTLADTLINTKII